MRTVKARGRQSKRPVCLSCGRAVLHGNLYCSKLCGQKPKAAHKQLTDAGFVQDSTMKNAYRKDGVAVTVEGVNHVGLEETLRRHGHAVETHRNRSSISGAV